MKIPSKDVSGYPGIMLRRRERMSRAGGVLEGFPPPRSDTTMPEYSLYAHAKRFRLKKNEWWRHADWMRSTYDVRTLALGIYDYLLTERELEEYAQWWNKPGKSHHTQPAIVALAKSRLALAKRAEPGVMFDEWIKKHADADQLANQP